VKALFSISIKIYRYRPSSIPSESQPWFFPLQSSQFGLCWSWPEAGWPDWARILPTYWAIVCIGQFWANCWSSTHFRSAFFHRKSVVLLILKKTIGFCYILGDCFANSSGHPESRSPLEEISRNPFCWAPF
jgi:hypothetical protein